MAPSEELSWRIPAEGDRQLYRIGVMQVVIASLCFGAMVLVVAPRDMRVAALAAIVPLAGFLLWLNWRKRGSGRRLPDNVRIDSRGVAWFDGAGQENLFARDQIEAFRIDFDEDTLCVVPALHLSLAGGFESQPIELHAPADPERVRQLLAARLRLRQRTTEQVEKQSAAALVSGIEFVPDDDEGVWEFRGTRADLLECCRRLEAVAGRLAAFPLGARPLALRFDATTLHFTPRQSRLSEIDGTTFSGSAEELVALVDKLCEPLASADAGATIEVPAFGDPDAGHVRLRVRNAV